MDLELKRKIIVVKRIRKTILMVSIILISLYLGFLTVELIIPKLNITETTRTSEKIIHYILDGLLLLIFSAIYYGIMYVFIKIIICDRLYMKWLKEIKDYYTARDVY